MNLLLGLLLTTGAALPARAQEVQRFQVEVRTVYVDVVVTREGKGVSGLTAEDFEVRDRGVPQEIRLMDVQTIPLSVMIVLDTSRSIYGEKLQHLRAGAQAFIEGLRDRDEAGLLAFSWDSRLLKSPSNDFTILREALLRPMPSGATALYDALFTGLTLLEGRPGRPVLLVYTDGEDNASWLGQSELLEAVRRSEALVHAIMVRSPAGVSVVGRVERPTVRMQPDNPSWTTHSAHLAPVPPPPPDLRRLGDTPPDSESFLKSLAKETGGKVWYAAASTDLTGVYRSVLQDLESRYLLSYEPRGTPTEGWHPIEVRLKTGGPAEIRARSGYMMTASSPRNPQ